MGRVWRAEIDGNVHTIAGDYKTIVTSGRGSILVDGEVVDRWGASWLGHPRERRFVVAGKPAVLLKTGLIREDFDLYIDGAVVRPER